MNRSVDGAKGRISLVLGHCAGMIDVVALPVWVGIVLIGYYGLEPQRAGALATLFLGGVVLSSLLLSPRIERIRGTLVAPLGFGVAAAAFFALTTTRDYATMAALHLVGGLAVGCGLSLTHSMMGASRNPHRLIAIAFTVLSVLSFGFLGGVPHLAAAQGGAVVFVVLGGIMLVTALFAAIGFPQRPGGQASGQPAGQDAHRHAPLSRGVWFAMIGTSLLTLSHSAMLSYIEPIGSSHGFGAQQIMGVLFAIGVVNLFPGLFAAIFERRFKARAVMVSGPLLQGVLGLILTQSLLFGPYAFAAALFPAVMIFTHTFIFAFLARHDPSTRAVAATPVMAMTGSALGPLFGGIMAQHFGYASIGWMVVAVALLAMFCFWQATQGTRQEPPAAGSLA